MDRPGSYRVLLENGDEGAALDVTVGSASPQQIDLDTRRVTVAGRAVGAATGAPVAGAVVVARRATPFVDLLAAPVGQARAEGDGAFALPLGVGVYRLSVSAEGFAVAERVNAKIERGREASVGKIALRDRRPLRVRLLDDQGAPWRFALAAVSSEGLSGDGARADANGIVTLADAPPGPVTVTTLASAVGVTRGLYAVPVDADPPRITLTRGGALDVHVSEPGGRPAAGVTVRVLKDEIDLTPSLRGRTATGQGLLRLGDEVDPEALAAAGERRVPLCANVAGVGLHAGVVVPAHDRARLERLLRYAARPPLCNERLSSLEDGRLLYRLKRPWRDGTTHVVLEPRDLIARLAALVPPRRMHLLRYHGVLGSMASWREQVVPRAPRARRSGGGASAHRRALGCGAVFARSSTAKDRSRRYPPHRGPADAGSGNRAILLPR